MPRLAPILAALALLALAREARADARAEARRHFRAGLAHIAKGNLKTGIAEMEKAYALKPHPNVLYNIARAYLELGREDDALDYFNRYLATDPPDRERVAVIVANLVQAKPAPPPPAPATPAETASAAPVANAGELAALSQRLQEQTDRLEKLLEERRGEAAPVDPVAIDTTRLPPAPEGGRDSEGRGDADVYEEITVTAARRAQTTLSAPSATTIITEDEIRMSGATTVPELLRRVPGIDVAEMNPSDVNLSLRGFNGRLANKLLVLVDGRSVYQDYLGATFWPLLTVGVEDIAQVEVVRGPGSALYGASAFGGVINIITKTAAEGRGSRAFVQGGNFGTLRSGYAFADRRGNVSHRTSLGFAQADNWSLDFGPRADVRTLKHDPTQSHRLGRLDTALTWKAPSATVTLGGGLNQFDSETVTIGALRDFALGGYTGWSRLDVASNRLRFKAFWNHTTIDARPAFWPEGLPQLPREPLEANVVDTEVQYDATFEALGTHRAIAGGGWRLKQIDWNYLRPPEATADAPHAVVEHHLSAFAQDEWQLSSRVTAVASYRLDRHPLVGLAQSPRVSLLYSPAPGQVARVSAATAFRVPTFFESYIALTPAVPPFGNVAVQFGGDTALEPERVASAELGWRASLFGERAEVDVAAYGFQVKDLIVQGALSPVPLAESEKDGTYLRGASRFVNDPPVYYAAGAEAAIRVFPAEGVDLVANVAVERIVDSQGRVAQEQTAPVKGYAGARWRTPIGLELNLDVHLVSRLTWTEREFDSTSATGVRYVAHPLPAYALVNGRAGWRVWDRFDVGLAVFNLLDDRHQEHPFGNVLGRRVTGTLAGSF